MQCLQSYYLGLPMSPKSSERKNTEPTEPILANGKRNATSPISDVPELLIKDKTDPESFIELPEIKQVSNTINKFIEWQRRNDVN